MLMNKINNLTYRSDEVSSEPTIPDPWQTPIPVPKVNTIAVSPAQYFSKESNSLISPAGNPNAPKLACHQSTSEEILLSDELKLTTNISDQIKQQLEKALGLLYWLRIVDRKVVSSNPGAWNLIQR